MELKKNIAEFLKTGRKMPLVSVKVLFSESAPIVTRENIESFLGQVKPGEELVVYTSSLEIDPIPRGFSENMRGAPPGLLIFERVRVLLVDRRKWNGRFRKLCSGEIQPVQEKKTAFA